MTCNYCLSVMTATTAGWICSNANCRTTLGLRLYFPIIPEHKK